MAQNYAGHNGKNNLSSIEAINYLREKKTGNKRRFSSIKTAKRWIMNYFHSVELKSRPSKRDQTPLCYNDGFYNSKGWKNMRDHVLEVYGRKCMKCKRTDVVMNVDHIKPRRDYPHLELEFDNLQVLCERCNKHKSNHYIHDYRD